MPSTLITGTNRGIGFELARQYLADGWQLYVACRNPASASELRRLAEDSDNKLRILAMDVTDPASIQATAAELDGQAIDVLINNAAWTHSETRPSVIQSILSYGFYGNGRAI